MVTRFNQFSLGSLMLVVAVVAVSLAWWLDRSRKPEVYYVQLFATHFERDLAKRNPMHPEYGKPVLLTTFSIQSETPFDVFIPHDYDPQIEIYGVLSMRGKRCVGELAVTLTAPDLAMHDDRITPLTIDKAHALQDPRFHLFISRSSNPDALVKFLKDGK